MTVAETRNITKAAQLLHVSQPSLSQYLNRLEQDLGVKLLDRSYTPIRLTEAGNIYLAYIRECIDVEQRFEKKLAQYKLQQVQSLAIGIPTQLTPLIFDKIVQGFIQNYPEIKLTVKEGTSITVMQQLIRGEVDIAFFHTKENEDSRFVRRILNEEKLFLACGRDSNFAGGRAASRDNPLIITKNDFSSIEDMRFLTTSKDYYLHRVMLGYIQEVGISPKHIIEIPHVRTIVNYILEPGSDGVSMLADFALQGIESPEYLTFFKVDGHDLSWYLTMNYLADTPLSKIAKQFWDDTNGILL